MKLSGVDGGATASGGSFVDWGFKYQSDFSAGVDSWNVLAGTAAGNIDSIGGEDNTLRFTCDTANDLHALRKETALLTIGKKYIVSFRYYLPSTNSKINGIRAFGGGGTSLVLSSTLNVTDTWTTFTSSVFTAISTSVLRVYAYNDASITFQDAGGDDVFYIKDITIQENPPDKYIGHLLRIKDSAGKVIQGFIKAAGTGETLSATELVTLGDFSASTGWTQNTGWSIGGGVASHSSGASAGNVERNISPSIGMLVKGTMTVVHTSGGGVRLIVDGNSTPAMSFSAVDTYRAITLGTWPAGARAAADWVGTVDNISIKQVLTPSATGVTIVSTKGGATFNWFNKNSAFNWNDANGYTYEIVKVNSTVAVVDSNTTAANEHVSLVDGNAFYFGSIDMTNYQDGRHYLWMKDSSGYVAFAKIKAEVPGGEALSDEINPDVPFDAGGWSGTGWVVSGGVATASNTTESVYRSMLTSPATKLFKTVYEVSSLTSGKCAVRLSAINGAERSATGTYTDYITGITSTNAGITGTSSSPFTGSITSLSVKQVTECAATGAHLMNAAGTRNMIYQHPLFNGNAIANIKVLYYGD
jgi:hypothetical protein